MPTYLLKAPEPSPVLRAELFALAAPILLDVETPILNSMGSWNPTLPAWMRQGMLASPGWAVSALALTREGTTGVSMPVRNELLHEIVRERATPALVVMVARGLGGHRSQKRRMRDQFFTFLEPHGYTLETRTAYADAVLTDRPHSLGSESNNWFVHPTLFGRASDRLLDPVVRVYNDDTGRQAAVGHVGGIGIFRITE